MLGFLCHAVLDWKQGMRNRTRDASASNPSGFQVVAAVSPPPLPHPPSPPPSHLKQIDPDNHTLTQREQPKRDMLLL